MLDFILNTLFGDSWVSSIIMILAASFILMSSYYIKQKLGKTNLKLVIIGTALLLSGVLLVSTPISHTYQCNHTKDLCQAIIRDITGNTTIEESFQPSKVSEVYIERVTSQKRNVKSIYYWLIAKVNGKEIRLDTAKDINQLPYQTFKNFFQDKKSRNYIKHVETPGGIEIGVPLLIAGLILFVIAFWPRNTSSEIKEALEILDEASQTFGRALFLKDAIKKNILSHQNQFIENIKQDERSVRKHVYSMIANGAADLVESGKYHIYRGTLNPMGPGFELLRVFDNSMDELVKLGDLSEDWAKKQKTGIRNNLKQVG